MKYKNSSEENQNLLITPKNIYAQFVLYYKQSKIGTLELKNETWIFTYSKSFKKQDSLNVIINFPDVNKQYQCKELWPFFIIRIPNLIKHKHNNNLVDLLARFGNKSIANPYNLKLLKIQKENYNE